VVNQTELPALLHRLGVPDEKILYLSSLYLDFDVFHPMPDVEKRYDVVFVGRLTANKGLLTILDAVNIVRRTHPDLTVCLLGRGPLQDTVTSRIATLGLENTVTLLERLPRAEDVAAFYNQARMLVCASTAEGGPRVTVEAMACGTPVISTPVGVVPDIITDGENGLLFRWQADELAEKITRLLDDESLQAHLGEAGRLAVQLFQAESVIARYAQGFQDVARRAKQQT
jgi:colanic acid/amylovoran biosynthesis glycosyltransferase